MFLICALHMASDRSFLLLLLQYRNYRLRIQSAIDTVEIQFLALRLMSITRQKKRKTKKKHSQTIWAYFEKASPYSLLEKNLYQQIANPAKQRSGFPSLR